MKIVLKLVVTLLLLIGLMFIAEQAYGAFVLGNQLHYGSITVSMITLLVYLVPTVLLTTAIYCIWKKESKISSPYPE